MINITNEIINHSKNNEIIITFSSNSYLPILEIWLFYIDLYHVDNYCVIALDKELYALLLKKGIPVVLMEMSVSIDSSTKDHLWVERILLISQLLEKGLNVLHSDADAFWVKDIRKYLLYRNSDLIFSIAYALPKDVASLWGFILCCGFFKITSNARTRKFMKDFLQKCRYEGDDQIAINRLLMEKGVVWAFDSNLFNRGYSPAYLLTLDVLPKKIVSRQVNSSAYIFHPFLSSKCIQGKVDQALSGLDKISSKKCE